MFIDSSALFAIVNARDENHARAEELWFEAIQAGTRLVCTNYVVLETFALLQRRLGVDAVRAFSTEVVPSLEVEWVDESLHRDGVAAVLAAHRRELSLVDCVSFAAMNKFGIREAFAFDQDFRDRGFECLP